MNPQTRRGVLRCDPVLIAMMLQIPRSIRIVGVKWEPFCFTTEPGGYVMLELEGDGLPADADGGELPSPVLERTPERALLVWFWRRSPDTGTPTPEGA